MIRLKEGLTERTREAIETADAFVIATPEDFDRAGLHCKRMNKLNREIRGERRLEDRQSKQMIRRDRLLRDLSAAVDQKRLALANRMLEFLP